MKAKRFNAWVLSALLVVFTVFPQKPSFAFIGFVPMAISAFGTGGTLISANILNTAVTSLIGGTIVALAITPTPLANGEALPAAALPIRIPTTTNLNTTNLVFPPPSAPSTSVPSTTVGYRFGTSSSSGPTSTTYATPFDYCNAVKAYNLSLNPAETRLLCVEVVAAYPSTPNGGAASCSPYSTAACRLALSSDPTKWYDFFYYTAPTCSAGYSPAAGQGSTCELTLAAAVTPDSKVDFQRGPTSFTSQDKDAPSASNARVNAGKVETWGTDSQGNPAVVSAGVDGSGNTTLGVSKQVKSSDGQTLIKTDNYVINKDTGLVTSVNSATTKGSIAVDANTSVPTVSTGSSVAPIPVAVDPVTGLPLAPAVPGSGTGSEPIVFPSDYARAGEAAHAATQVKTSVDAITTKLTDTQTVNDPTLPDYPDVWGTTFNAISGWQLPGHSSQCPSSSFEFNNRIYMFDVHCQIFINHFVPFQAVMNVVWLVLAFAVVMGA